MSKRDFYNREDDDISEVKRKFSKSGNKGKWTDDEDEILKDCVDELNNQWSEIAHRLKGRTGKDCRHRWEYSLILTWLKALGQPR